MSPVSHPMQTRAPMMAGGGEGGVAAKHYRAFISYSHADSNWARWLMWRLENYQVPARFHGQPSPLGLVGPRIAPVFRDRDELPTTSDLGETIRAGLRESAALIVICSPASAQSRWVREEILQFKRLGGEPRVFAFIVAGEPKHAGAADDCFSPALRSTLGPDGQLSAAPAEHVAADARPQGDGKEDAFVRLVSGLLGVGFDELRQRELQRRHRRMKLIAGGSVFGMAITFGLAAVAWQARNDARRHQEQAEDLLEFMLGDLRAQVARVGRLELLQSVVDKSMTYFDSLNPRDVTDTTLERQAKALTHIGEIRMAQALYPEAARVFSTAYERAAGLVTKHPGNGEMLFDRAQAEYWIGYLHYTRGDVAPAREWLTRYRDTSVALVSLEPGNMRWQLEATYGHHNLAVLELERGTPAAARAAFLGEMAVREKIAAAKPKDLELKSNVGNVISYLGTVAERSGDYAGAIERFAQQTQMYEAMVRDDPGTAHWLDRVANALALEATVFTVTGQRAAALNRRNRASELLEPLVAADPANRVLHRALLKLRLQTALLMRADGDGPAARRLVEGARGELEKLTKLAPTDRKITGLLAVAWRLEAELREAAGRADAMAAATQAIAMSEDLLAKERADDELVGDFLNACVVAGRIARTRGEHDAATRHWQRALDVALPRVTESNNWRLLDPAARALAALGRGAESRAIVGRLQQFGYQPLDPWPGSDAAALSVSNSQPAQN